MGYDKDGRTISEISHIFAGDTLLSTFEKKTSTVTANAGTCSIPVTGDFTLTSSCTIIGNVLAPASIIIPSGKVLTITANSKLLIDLKHFKILVKKGGGILIKKTTTLRQVKTSDVVTNSAPTVAYILTDHLGSVAVSTNAQGAVTELSDYYPYGSIRLDTGSFKEQRKYIGQEYDVETGLNYLNARYYNSNTGQFISEDPVFWEIGQTKDGKSVLLNPQAQNSYSYAGNNPIISSDPSGRIFGIDDAAIVIGIGTLAMYAPQITSFLQSLTTPLGQFGLSQAGEDAQKGNYKMAAFGVLTAGEVPAIKVAQGLTLGEDFGKLGKVVENTAGEIRGFFRAYAKDPYHGLDQAISRGVTPTMLLDTVKNPLVTLKQASGNILRLTEKAGVVLNKTGQVVTTYARAQFLPHVVDVLSKIKK